MSEAGLRQTEIVGRVGQAVASDAPDDAALGEVVRILHAAKPSWEWVGVYLLSGDTLVLGPYVGEETDFTHIRIGDGVCGTAVSEDCNQIVEDVRALDNYIACSLRTRSELVVLIRNGGRVIGQFDIDSEERAAFTKQDEALLEELTKLVAPRCAALAAAL